MYIKTEHQLQFEKFMMYDNSFARLRSYFLISELNDITLILEHKGLKDNDVQYLHQKYGMIQISLELYNTMVRFRKALYSVIWRILHEKTIHSLIAQYCMEFGGRYDEETHEYEKTYEIASDTYLALFSRITKGTNKGRIRIDYFLERPEYTYSRIHEFIEFNELYDEIDRNRELARKSLPYYITNDDGDEEPIVETQICRVVGSHGFENSMEAHYTNSFTISKFANKYRKKPLRFITFLLIFTDVEEPKLSDIESTLKNYKTFNDFLNDYLVALDICNDPKLIPADLINLGEENWKKYHDKTAKSLYYTKKMVVHELKECIAC